MSIPTPGEKVRGSETGSPIMAILDLLGRKWALGIIWNMSFEPVKFRELQSRCQSISPAILNSRIKDLREAGIIKRTLDGYILDKKGIELQQILKPLDKWSTDWALQIFNYDNKTDCNIALIKIFIDFRPLHPHNLHLG